MTKGQLELQIELPRQPDRNHKDGGRSFYFFDFDDNVAFLRTPLFLFNKLTGEEKAVSTREFAATNHFIGKPGPWKDFEIRLDPQTGSFRRFRHKKFSLIEKFLLKKQPLVEDMLEVLQSPPHEWRGPSWNFFWHAVHNERPLSIITARGHSPETMKDGIRLMKKAGHLDREPNYLSIFPVSHGDVRLQLGDKDQTWHTARLKKAAIQFSVEEAFRQYGANPSHRFGMSDDDPVNVALIVEAMQELKKKYPRNSFFVIDTHAGQLVKNEIMLGAVKLSSHALEAGQLNLFND